MADTSSTVNDDHPLALELSSLRAAVSRYQHEAHATSLKLQRHSLEASQAIEHARALERENARLKEEAAVLRANPDTSPTQATFQVPELTLALRRLSDKLTSVEATLLASTEELVDARSQLANGHNELEAARALAADARAREEEGLARERDLARKLKAAEEERRMSDLVVQEYADLVRKLDGRTRMPSDSSSTMSIDLQRPNNGSTATLVDSLAEGKSGLQRLLEEFNGDSERLETEITKLQGNNGQLYKELEIARLAAEHDRSELAKIRHELDKYRADDTTAAKMVSRYMKFSQTSTDTLQKAMDALRSRHSATLHTLNAEIAHLQHALEHQRAETDRLRSALDDLTEDIAREAFGRRREVSLRLAFLGREENLAESLRRWIRRARESLDRAAGGSDSGALDADVLKEAFSRAMLDAEGLLEMLNSQPSTECDKSPSGSVARLILAQDTVSSMTHELQEETVRRLRTERKLARLETPDHPEDVLAPGTKPLVHPVPHHASASKPEISLLEQSSPPSAPDVTLAGQPQAVFAEDILSPGVSIDEIVIVPSLDSSEPQASDHLSHLSPRPFVADDESHTLDALSENTQSDIQGPPVPTASHTFQSSDFGAIETPLAVAPSSPTPELVVAHPNDTLPIPFPSNAEIVDATIDPGLPTLARSSPQSSVERISKPPAPSNVTPEASQRNSRAVVPMPLQLDATDGSALSPLSSTPISPAASAETSKESSLLADLSKVKHRYDNVQRGFRDCHLALKELKKSLGELSSPATAASADMHTLLRKAVERLDDYNEDARVELEIRIADDERVSSGYEALLSIPGALAHADGSESVDSSEMLKEVAAFVNGTDRAVEKATQSFTQKLDDLEHDIASIKRTLHELALSSSDESSLSATSPSSRPSTSPKWAGWAPSFLSPPRSTSPAPTFGSVMTSPRLRHSSFTRPRESPVDSPTDPLANLGLRIAVPVPVRSPTYGGLSPGSGGPQRAGPRQRTTSGMFMLGLGMRSTSFGSGMGVHASASASKTSLATPSGSPSLSRLATAVSPKDDESSEEEDGERKDGIDSDVE